MLSSLDTSLDGREILKNRGIHAANKLSPLSQLLPPEKKINIAVFDFPDLTGAYKPSDSFATYSKAVSQGADAIVIDALRLTSDGKWFNVLERKGINAISFERNLLQESMTDQDNRKNLAIKAMQMMLNKNTQKTKKSNTDGITVNQANQFASEQGVFSEQSNPNTQTTIQQQPSVQIDQLENGQTRVSFPGTLPKLQPSEYILQGGIIAYDSNIVSSGTGLRFLNVGAFGETRKDIVTVNMRLVHVVTGEIILSTTVTKGIYSQKLQGSGINYVSIDRILEVEAGVSYNEPVFEALNITIQAALYDLIQQGIQAKIWRFKENSMTHNKIPSLPPERKS
jgi:curli biogenesis system outer membrane secretion channel CsgG